jgi:putative copper export protein
MLLGTNVAAAVAIRSLGLVLIAAGLFRASRPGYVASIIGATLVAASFALTGHTAAHDLRWALIGFLVVHLIIVSFWFGALLPIVMASRREELDVTGDLIDVFSALATKLVPVIFVAGLVMSVFLLEELRNLWTPYGASLLMKVAGFSALMALAALNKWRFGPGIASGNKASLDAFRRTAVAEWWLITAVIAVTAVMTGLFSPTH